MARRSASVLSFGIVREFHLGFLVWLTTYSRLPPQASPKNSLPSSYYFGIIALILVINLPLRPPTPDEGPSEPPQSQSSAVRKVKKKARMCALRIPNGSSEPGGPLETNHGETCVPSGGTSPSDFRHLTSSHRFSLSLLTSTLTKNASASPLTSTLTKTKDLKSFIINTYKKEGGVTSRKSVKKGQIEIQFRQRRMGHAFRITPCVSSSFLPAARLESPHPAIPPCAGRAACARCASDPRQFAAGNRDCWKRLHRRLSPRSSLLCGRPTLARV